MIDRDTAKREIKRREPDFLQKAKKVGGKVSYVCPQCGNGSGSDGTGILLDPKDKEQRHYKCFKCGLYEDVIGLWKLHTGVQDDAEAFRGLYDYYHLEVDSAKSGAQPSGNQNQPKNERNTDTQVNIHTNVCADDYTQFYIQANKDIWKTDYHRGISLDTLNRFQIGYVERWKHPKAPRMKESPRLIIPTSKSSYLARHASAEDYIDYEGKVQNKSKVGAVHLFNGEALKTAQKPVFIVEGELDALSIIDVGGEAIGLGSVGNIQKLLALIDEEKPAQTLVLALDNDEAGIKASKELSNELEERGIPHYALDPCMGHKDANEALQTDREGFSQMVAQAVELEELIQETEKEDYLNSSAYNYLQGFINGIAESVNTPAQKTGFSKLDSVLDGGLYEGLYTIGAVTSLGKTTLIMQIADQIASTGEDVLIFSLEMSRAELMAKSISRLTILDVLNNGGDTRNAKTVRGITVGDKYQNYSQQEKDLIQRAIKAYGQYAKHIFISEGFGDIGYNHIRMMVEKHKHYTGKAPVVVIDYLQILAPYDVRATDKQNTDKAVLELKRISRDYKTPVIAISSLNRQGYSEPVTLASYKESGAIEYGSDVLLGLQLSGVGEKSFNAEEAKKKNPREVELVILKNRNGRTGDTISFNYYSMFNYFKEMES